MLLLLLLLCGRWVQYRIFKSSVSYYKDIIIRVTKITVSEMASQAERNMSPGEAQCVLVFV